MTGNRDQMQLVDHQQTFSPQLQYYLSSVWNLINNGLDYKIVAIFGSQSSGKSTLLNGVFGTNFAVMTENNRVQTTKGIWLSKARDAPYLIFDVEGTDGRERGECQDFERKSALFSLAVAQILIINIWEHSIGLYNGANMGLLKTVFEVNLQLFQKKGSPKTILLFIVRDFLGNTPLENLEQIILTDLKTIWSSLTKPSDLYSSQFSDFFYIEFATLPHKYLCPETFNQELKILSNRFHHNDEANSFFTSKRSLQDKIVPIDGLYSYTSSIWETIRTNKDLDLPTQKELLAQFRCDEIASELLHLFSKKIKDMISMLNNGKLIENFGKQFHSFRTTIYEEFSKEASRYKENVVEKKKQELMERLNSTIHSCFLMQLKILYKRSVHYFLTQVDSQLKESNFSQTLKNCKESSLNMFKNGARDAILPETDWKYDDVYNELVSTIDEKIASKTSEQIKKITDQACKSMRSQVAAIILQVLDNGHKLREVFWEDVFMAYKRCFQSASSDYSQRLSSIELSECDTNKILEEFSNTSWECFLARFKEELTDGLILARLKKRFERVFKYNPKGIPIIWKPGDDMDTPFREALDHVYQMLDTLSIMQVPVGDYLPKIHDSIYMIPKDRKENIREQFLKEAEMAFMEAKRAVVSTTNQIPFWLILLLVVLGWNEFMTILSSPLYLLLTCILMVVIYLIKMLRVFPPINYAFCRAWEAMNPITATQ